MTHSQEIVERMEKHLKISGSEIIRRLDGKFDSSAGENGCWPWLGAKDRRGYGYLTVHYKKYRPHRILAGASNSEVACHKCDNPSCVNPSHLFVGTQADNIKDMVRKGRHASQRKTHCPRGHEYSQDNLLKGTGGERVCKTCSRAAGLKKYYASKIRHGREVGR